MKTRHLIILAMAVGCGDKSDSTTGAAEETTKTSSEFVPSDKASQQVGAGLASVDMIRELFGLPRREFVLEEGDRQVLDGWAVHRMTPRPGLRRVERGVQVALVEPTGLQRDLSGRAPFDAVDRRNP